MALSPPTAPTAPDLNSPSTYNARVLAGFEYCFTTLPDWIATLDASDLFSVQSSSTDTTAGTIALQGNDADYADLTVETLAFPGTNNAIDTMDQNVGWTPTIFSSGGGESVGYSVQSGVWSRYGDDIKCTGRINVSSVSGGSGFARIGGLPLTSVNSSAQQGTVQFGLMSGFSTAIPTVGYTQQNDVYAHLATVGATGTSLLSWSEITSSTNINFTIIYKAT